MENRRAIFWILVIGLFLRLTIVFAGKDFLSSFVYDDAYYYFNLAQHIMAGEGVTADGITTTNGFHPLWLILMLPVYTLKLAPLLSIRVALFFATFLDLGAAWMLGRRFGPWAAALYFLNPLVIYQSMTGMETPLVAFFLVAFLLFFENMDRDWFESLGDKHLIYFGVVSGLLFLARTDMIFVIVAGYLYLWHHFGFFTRTWFIRVLLIPAGITVFLVSPWLIWNYLNFGTIMQASGSAYPWVFKNEFFHWHQGTPGLAEFGQKIIQLGRASLKLLTGYYGGLIPAGILGYLVVRSWSHGPTVVKWLLVGIGMAVLYHTFFRWFPRVWYFHGFYLVTVPLLVVTLMRLGVRWRIAVVVILLAGGLIVIFDSGGTNNAFAGAFKKQNRADAALAMLEALPKNSIVGAWNSGYPQYYAPDSVKVINLDGLANNGVIDYYRQGHFLRYCDSLGISYIVDNQFFMDWSFGKYVEDDQRGRIKLLAKMDNIGLKGNNMCLFIIIPASDTALWNVPDSVATR